MGGMEETTTDEMQAWLADAIHYCTEVRGDSFEEFADLAGVRVTTVRRWRRGETFPDSGYRDLAFALGRERGVEFLERVGWRQEHIDEMVFVDDPLTAEGEDLRNRYRQMSVGDRRLLLTQLRRDG